MKFTDVSVRLMQRDDSKLKAVASVTIDDCFVVHDIKVLEGTQGYFVTMPSRKTPDGQYKDVAHPINTPTREELNKLVLEAFEKAKAEQPAAE
ncbi:MAG: septation regulator SpoVG [Clostridia bacterium]|nr:septation regulator SpoVG [Clostridia bacterium]